MPTIKPYAGTSIDRLKELIRTRQTPVLPKSVKYVFSNLRLDNPQLEGTTVVTVVASAGTRVDPPVDVHYHRLNIDELSLLPQGFTEPVEATYVPFTTHSILDKINKALGIDLVPEEVLNESFDVQAERYPLTITGNKSFAWVDSTHWFKMLPTDIDLNDAIPDPVLDGLVYVQPEE